MLKAAVSLRSPLHQKGCARPESKINLTSAFAVAFARAIGLSYVFSAEGAQSFPAWGNAPGPCPKKIRSAEGASHRRL